MKAINSFLTGVAKEQTTQFLIDNGMVTPNDKGNVTLSAMRRALKELDDDALTDLADSFGFSEQENQVDAVIDSLGFSKDEIGKFTTSKGVDIAIINATYKKRSSSGSSAIFEFSKGFIVISAARILQLARAGSLVVDKQYPIQMDSLKPLVGQPGYFSGKAIESGFDGIEDLYLAAADKKTDLKIALKDMRDQGASDEEIQQLLANARQAKLNALV
jgi:hypothetical protein